MSNTSFAYRQTTDRGLTLVHSSTWHVRDDDDKYGTDNEDKVEETLLELSDRITERLTRAQALAWVLQGSEHHPEKAGNITAMIIAELIHEALEAHEKQWDKIRRSVKQVR